MSQRKPILVVLGQKGTGKSYLINKIFDTVLHVNDTSTHVTKEQLFEEKEQKYFSGYVDTVGLDADEHNFVSVSKLYDRPLVLLYLNNDLRIDTSLRTIEERLGIPSSKIWVFNSKHFEKIPAGFKQNMQYEDIFIQMDQLSSKVVIIPAPPVIVPVVRPPVLHVTRQEVKSSPKLKPLSKEEVFRRNFPHVKSCKLRLRCMNETPFDVAAAFKKITSQEVTAYRKIGDALLSLLLETMALEKLLGPLQVVEAKTNTRLSDYFRHVLGPLADTHKMRLFPQGIGIESEGDIVEALLGKSYSLSMFDQLIKFLFGA